MAYTPETADEGGYGSEQAYNNAMGEYGGAVKHYRQYEDKMRRRIEARQDAQMAMQKREQERKSGVWSNLGLLGTIIGAPFGGVGAAVGGFLGSLGGMGIAAARGGDPFDLGAQFEYMDMGLLGSAATGIAGSMANTKAANDWNRIARAGNRSKLLEGGMDPAHFQPGTMMPGGKFGHGSMGVDIDQPSPMGSYQQQQFSPGAGRLSQRLSRRLQGQGGYA